MSCACTTQRALCSGKGIAMQALPLMRCRRRGGQTHASLPRPVMLSPPVLPTDPTAASQARPSHPICPARSRLSSRRARSNTAKQRRSRWETRSAQPTESCKSPVRATVIVACAPLVERGQAESAERRSCEVEGEVAWDEFGRECREGEVVRRGGRVRHREGRVEERVGCCSRRVERG